jgi:ectoine hydroxylase-related dioxygenase (phytanoyl-CoA dioxygenase family)
MTTTAFDVATGYFVAHDVFDADECDAIVEHVDAAAFDVALGDRNDGPLSYRPMLHLTSDPLLRVATDRRWADVVFPLLDGGRDGVRLFWEQAVVKPPQARTELPWHQDSGYTPTVPEEYVTCWLALDDADESNGCLWVQPGSHVRGRTSHVNGGTGPFRVGYDGDDVGIPVTVRRGDVLVFSSLLMHRSGPNTTDRPRRAWILQYCVGSATSALSGKPLDDRLLVADDGQWLDTPVRQRDIDLLAIVANYDQS